jgi:hypothetical protein
VGRDPEKKSGRDRPRVAIQKISGRDPWTVATQKKNPVATELSGRDPVEKIFLFFFLIPSSDNNKYF